MLKFNQGVKVQNPRAYEAGAIQRLQYLLEVGCRAEHDPGRKNFYTIEDTADTYYIYISPVSGNVVLLAKWLHQSQECFSSSNQLVVNHA